MTQESIQRELLGGGGERRRIPRYSCSGQAQITCLPLSGALLRGRVRDLGLGGCCIESVETAFPLDLGAQTEILVEVNSWFFRAMGHVRAVRGHSGISMEFVRMSAGGYSMLADLVADLETGVSRRKSLLDHSRRILRSKSGRGSVLKNSLAIAGTIVPAHSGEETSLVANGYGWVRGLYPGATSVDLFV
jgi:hypothetical protein